MMHRRHTLVWLDGDGIEYAARSAHSLFPTAPEKMASELVRSGIPGIVRRQENPRDDILELGFSSCEYFNGVRFRAIAEAPVSAITRTMTPSEVLVTFDYTAYPAGSLIGPLLVFAGQLRLSLGVYGSTAMQLVTALPYCHPDSDLDLYLECVSGGGLKDFHDAVIKMEEKTSIRLDVELDIGGGYAVKLKELYQGQKTILAKGYGDISLFLCSDIISRISFSEESYAF